MKGRDIPLLDFHTNRLLLDTITGAKFGGTGTRLPWNWALDLIAANRDREFILAGGLNSENVAEAVNQTRPFRVDVASGVETGPGRKDICRLR
jgi:phosphoribosylanthranilate isomerase